MKTEYIWTCDYCGKESNTKKESDKHELGCDKNPSNNKFFYIHNGKQAFLVYWVTTLLVFGSAIIISNRLPEPNILNYQPIFILFLVNILVGCVVFLEMLITSSKFDKKTPGVIKYSVVIALIYLFLASTVNVSAGYIAKKEKDFKEKIEKITQPTPTTTPVPTSTPIPKKTSSTKTTTSSNINSGDVECIGPDGKMFNTTMDECKKLNDSWNKPVDYMVNCTMSDNCGNRIQKMKKSECDQGVCCEVNKGNWVYFTSIAKCHEAQSSNSSPQTQQPDYSSWPEVTAYGGTMVLRCKGDIEAIKRADSERGSSYAAYSAPELKCITDNRETEQCKKLKADSDSKWTKLGETIKSQNCVMISHQ